ncbi:MAG: hypothetical protein M3406_18100 [Chloroflexota bacterium]|nr:hypothetical protein [Chloroflexota bacterium]
MTDHEAGDCGQERCKEVAVHLATDPLRVKADSAQEWCGEERLQRIQHW